MLPVNFNNMSDKSSYFFTSPFIKSKVVSVIFWGSQCQFKNIKISSRIFFEEKNSEISQDV
jgi:hypothetical protein